jgi:hypothetical protein
MVRIVDAGAYRRLTMRRFDWESRKWAPDKRNVD